MKFEMPYLEGQSFGEESPHGRADAFRSDVGKRYALGSLRVALTRKYSRQ
jgi:hypothetical protein